MQTPSLGKINQKTNPLFYIVMPFEQTMAFWNTFFISNVVKLILNSKNQPKGLNHLRWLAFPSWWRGGSHLPLEIEIYLYGHIRNFLEYQKYYPNMPGGKLGECEVVICTFSEIRNLLLTSREAKYVTANIFIIIRLKARRVSRQGKIRLQLNEPPFPFIKRAQYNSNLNC